MKQILIISDDSTLTHPISELFSGQYGITDVTNFIDALRYIDKKKPALILLDFDMHFDDITSNGIEVVRLLRDKAEACDIPLMLLSDSIEREDEILCLQMGVEDFVSRSYIPEMLEKRVTRVIEYDTYRKNDRKPVRKIDNTAATDSLTGLWNKVYIEKVVMKYLSEAGTSGALIIVDIKNFKRVNEELGYTAGDEVLKTLARALRAIFPDDATGRIGGDEFVVFIREWTSTEAVSRKVDALIRRLDEFFIKATHGIASLIAGISKAPLNGTTFDELYECAGKALYLVKKQRLNPFGFYEDDKTVVIDESNPTAGLQTNIVTLLEQLRESEEATGAYWQEYKPFIEIYRFIAREISRTRKSVFVLLLSVTDVNEDVPAEDILSITMERLHKVIQKALRKGDVFTRYSQSQYILLLLDTNSENASAVAERIIATYGEVYGSLRVSVKYQLEKLQAKQM